MAAVGQESEKGRPLEFYLMTGIAGDDNDEGIDVGDETIAAAAVVFVVVEGVVVGRMILRR